MVQNIDYAPTFLELAGVEVPSDIHGRSFLPVLKGEAWESGRDGVYYHYYEYPDEHAVKRHLGVRTETHKLIHFYGEDGSYEELYDLEKDPHELSNVIEDKEYARIRARLSKALNGFRKRLQVDEF